MSATPRTLEIPIVSTEECVDSHSEFFYFTSPTTLCAGSKNGEYCFSTYRVYKERNERIT